MQVSSFDLGYCIIPGTLTLKRITWLSFLNSWCCWHLLRYGVWLEKLLQVLQMCQHYSEASHSLCCQVYYALTLFLLFTFPCYVKLILELFFLSWSMSECKMQLEGFVVHLFLALWQLIRISFYSTCWIISCLHRDNMHLQFMTKVNWRLAYSCYYVQSQRDAPQNRVDCM